MKLHPVFNTVLASLTFVAFDASAENQLSANIGVTSDYIWRGVTQSDNKPSIFTGLDLENSKGWYAGAWLATVDYDDDTNFEYDVYGGYQFSQGEIHYDLGLIYYGYQGEDDLNLSEIVLSADYKDFNFGISILADSDYGDDFADHVYYQANYQFNLPKLLPITVHAGLSTFNEGDNYRDFNISTHYENFTFLLSHTTGDGAKEDTLFSVTYQHNFNF